MWQKLGNKTEEVWVCHFPAERQTKIANKKMITSYSVNSEQIPIPSILSILLSGAESCQINTITGYSVYSEQTTIPSINSAIRSRIDGILFRSFQNQNRSQKNTITTNSVYSYSRIVPKERAL